MQLQKQVCSLELAKKLKALGVKQEAIHGWMHTRPFAAAPADWSIKASSAPEDWEGEACAAFTVAELGQMLPYTALGAYLATYKGNDDWSCAYGLERTVRADTEADARAKMLIYLLENKLIPL